MASPNTVLLHGRDDDRKDGEANGTITPGELIEISGSGSKEDKTFVVHSTAPSTDTEGAAVPRFALEAKAGRGIDDDYSSGDYLEYRTGLTGDEIYAWLDTGENASIDDPLESAGNGALAVHTGSDDTDTTTTQTYYDGAIVAHATEAVDNSGGSSPVRIKVEVR